MTGAKQSQTRERTVLPFETGYHLGSPVDELKPHYTPKGIECKIRRGVVAEVKNGSRTAAITCDCGRMVTESI